jgi:hypothetical protein
MKKFYSMEEYREYYFPKETAAQRERELMENPGAWGREQARKALEKYGNAQ